ncbi:MAG: CHASE4 domain-containing protein, partial [Candidatus Nanoarchaeia archaeon]
MNSIKSLIFSKENNKAIVRNISIAGLSILIVIAIFLISLRVSFFNELNRIQIQRCFELKSRIQAAFEDEKNRIKTLCDDWSHWDELYYSVKGGTDKFYEDNANPNIFEKLRLDIICTLDNSGKIVGGRKYDRKNDCSYSIDGKYLALLQNSISSILLAAGKDTFCDAVIFENEILLGGISPIYRNDGSGPSNGFIFMGRLFSDDARRQIWGELSENIHIIEATEYEKYQRSQTHSFDLQGKDCVIDRKGDSLAVIWPLRFVDGKTLKAFCLKIHNDVLRVFFRNTLIASAIFILFIAIVAFLFKILSPLFRFSEAFSRTGIWSGVFSFSSFVVLIGGILISIVVFWFYSQIE